MMRMGIPAFDWLSSLWHNHLSRPKEETLPVSQHPNPRCAYLIAIAHQVLGRIVEPDLRAAFLFGSVAWGDADAASDIDIMLLLDRPAGYREVTRVRVADLLGYAPADGPRFVDLDRFSVDTFNEVTHKGGWGQRVAHSIILKDTDNYFERIREQVTAGYFEPAARVERFRRLQAQAEAHRAAMRAELDIDETLAALYARLALEAAAGALLELDDARLSLTHFVESVRQALFNIGHGDLYSLFLHALAVDAGPESVDTSLQAYRVFADALKGWMAAPDVAGRLSTEDQAWAAFTYGAETYEEIDHKVTTFGQLQRLPALLYYLDGLLYVPIRINLGKILLLRSSGAVGRISIPDFHVALRAEPRLFETWVSALRLGSPCQQALNADELTAHLLDIGEVDARN